MDISKIINLNINLATGAVPKAGFGVLCIAGAHAGFTDRIKSYSQLSDLTDDHFNTEHAIYIAAQAYFSAKPNKPTSLMVARRNLNTAIVRVVTATASTDYTHTIDGVDFTHSSGAAPTTATIAAALVVLINAAYAPAIAIDLGDGYYSVQLISGSTVLASDVGGTLMTQNAETRVTIAPYDILTTYRLYLNDEDYTSVGEASAAAVAAAFVVAINADTDNNECWAYHDGASAFFFLASTQDGSDVVIDADTNGAGAGDIAVTNPGITETWATALTAARVADDTWYGLSVINRNIDQQIAVAAWTETELKIHGYATEDDDVINTTAVYDTVTTPAQCSALNYFRTWGIWNAGANGGASDNFADCAWWGRMLTYDPDQKSVEWAYKTLTGCIVDNLTATQLTNTIGNLFTGAGGKNISVYVETGGVDITLPGKVGAGEWIAIMTGRDWLYARVTEGILTVLSQNAKVPYSDKGIALIAGQISIWFEKGIKTEFLLKDVATWGLPGYSVRAPKRADVSAANVALHVLTGVTGDATVAGAILVTSLTINLSV